MMTRPERQSPPRAGGAAPCRAGSYQPTGRLNPQAAIESHPEEEGGVAQLRGVQRRDGGGTQGRGGSASARILPFRSVTRSWWRRTCSSTLSMTPPIASRTLAASWRAGLRGGGTRATILADAPGG